MQGDVKATTGMYSLFCALWLILVSNGSDAVEGTRCFKAVLNIRDRRESPGHHWRSMGSLFFSGWESFVFHDIRWQSSSMGYRITQKNNAN